MDRVDLQSTSCSIRTLKRSLHLRTVTGPGGGPEKTILNSPGAIGPGFDVRVAYLRPADDPDYDLPQRAQSLGVELVEDREKRTPAPRLGAAISRRALELGLNMNIVNFPGLSSVWRMAPPLTVTDEEIDRALAILDQAIRDCLAAPGADGR